MTSLLVSAKLFAARSARAAHFLSSALNFYAGAKAYEEGDWAKAAKSYSQIAARLRDDPEGASSAKVFSRLTICHHMMGNRAESERHFKRFVGTVGRMRRPSRADSM